MKTTFLTFVLIMSYLSTCLASCSSPNENNTNHEKPSPDALHTSGNDGDGLSKSSSMKKVEIKDQALNMTMLTLNVPAGWTLHQDVASNPNGSGYLKFLLAMESPEGEIQGFLPLMMNYNAYVMYGQQSGMYFDDMVYYLMHYCSQPFLEKFTPGNRMSDREALASEEGKQYREFAMQYANMIQQMGGYQSAMDFDIIRMDFNAFRKHVPYKGVLKAAKIGVIDQNPYLTSKYGIILGGFVLAPENLFAQAEIRKIDMDLQVNPQWDAKRSQIIEMETQRMSQDHQARMAQQQQQFNAHQQNMASMRQSFDQQNQAWYDRNFGSSGSGSYSSNASVTDAITGYTSFSDPYTGHQIKKDGHYNYWYTNEFGEYHGTNDPNFSPGNHYSGNWKPIQPLKPDH